MAKLEKAGEQAEEEAGHSDTDKESDISSVKPVKQQQGQQPGEISNQSDNLSDIKDKSEKKSDFNEKKGKRKNKHDKKHEPSLKQYKQYKFRIV